MHLIEDSDINMLPIADNLSAQSDCDSNLNGQSETGDFRIGVLQKHSEATGTRTDDFGRILDPGQKVVILLESSKDKCEEYIDRFDRQDFPQAVFQRSIKSSMKKKKLYFDSAEYFSKDGKIEARDD
ncbi:MAG: hypothetical protein MHMPM18_000754 [Marteilia pararefringens]